MRVWGIGGTMVVVSVIAVGAFRYLGTEKPARAAVFCGAMPAAVAHRGGTEQAVENTLGAFRAAGEAGIRLWELDVHFDAQNTPVVLHDATVDRISPLSGPIRELKAGGEAIPTDDGQHVPTLREVYELAVSQQAHVFTELKATPTAAQWRRLADDIDDTLGRTAVTIMSFKKAHVLAAAKRLPGIRRALVHDEGVLTAEQIKRFGPVLNVRHGLVTREGASQWHAADIETLIWTVNDETQWEKFAAWPIDGFVTDKPLTYRKWAANRCNPWS